MSSLFGRLFGRPTSPAQLAEAPALPAASPKAEPVLGSDEVRAYFLTAHTRASLQVNPATSSLETAPGRDLAYAALALVPQAMRHVCLLVSPELRPFRIARDPITSIAPSLRILPADTNNIVRLMYPIGTRHFLAVDDAVPGEDAPVPQLSGPGASIHALFLLTPREPADLPPPVRALARELGEVASAGLRAEPLLQKLSRRTVRPELVETLLRVMPACELEALARILLQSPAALESFRRALPASVEAQTDLPRLAAWALERNAVPGGTAVCHAEDGARLIPNAEAGPCLPPVLALQNVARRYVLPRRGACLIATARNEGAYLLDWISYHLSIGFEHIFVYSNDNNDGSDRLLAAIAKSGAITWINNSRSTALGPQPKAYAHALTLLPQVLDYAWAGIIDIDEYIGFDTGMFASFTDFLALQEAQNVDAIALCWLMFGGMPDEAYRPEPLVSRFTRRASEVNHHVKSLCRPRLFCGSQPHYPFPTLDAPFVFRTQNGMLHHGYAVEGNTRAFAENPGAEQAWVSHYFLRTPMEAAQKLMRGRADWAASDQAQINAYNHIVSETFLTLARPEYQVSDNRMIKCAQGQTDVLHSLLALPEVAAIDAEIKAAYPTQLQRAADVFLAIPPVEGEPRAVRQFRKILQVARYGK